MSLREQTFPYSCKLSYKTEEIRFNTLGIYSDFGNTVQGLTDEHTNIPELYSDTRLNSFTAKNITDIVQDQQVFTEIEPLIQTAVEQPQICYKYQTDNIIFIVTPELRSVYTLQSTTTELTQPLIDTYKKTIPINQTPELQLIGNLHTTDEPETFLFKTTGLKMLLLRKQNCELRLYDAEPKQTIDFYADFKK